MKIHRLLQQFTGMTDAIKAFPLTTLFIVILYIVNLVQINSGSITDYEKWLATLAVAVFASAVADLFKKRVLTYNIAIAFTLIFYFIVSPNYFILSIQVGVVLSALLMAFIWRAEDTFSTRFFHIFKSVLITAFFSFVIFVGLTLIYAAINYLLFEIHYDMIEYIAATVFGLFTPLFFLSLSMQEEEPPRILVVLLSYVIVPLVMVYTVILVIYIALHFTDWSENLLEPLLVSFATAVLVVYYLTYQFHNKLVEWFRRIFPKVLLVIVLYQLVVSIMKIGEAGITHGRYYVILFGVFAAIIALVITFMKKKQWLVAPIFIAFSFISVIPPVDAFTISKNNQTNLLQERLQSLGMFENEQIVPKSDISKEDQQFITEKYDYLQNMEYEIEWLTNKPFDQQFGFDPQYEDYSSETYYGGNINMDEPIVYPIDKYEYFVHVQFMPGKSRTEYQLDSDLQILVRKDQLKLVQNDNELIAWSIDEIQSMLTNNYKTLTKEEATVIIENDRAILEIVVQSAQLSRSEKYAELYVFVHVK